MSNVSKNNITSHHASSSLSTKKIVIVGGGIAGLSAACVLGKEGYEVHLYEKNEQLGGRASVLNAQNYAFDMGPSWYWMPDIFENFFQSFDHTTEDFYTLAKLDPGFKMIFGKDNEIHIPASFEKLCDEFEQVEKGAGLRLKAFMDNAKIKYEVSTKEFIYTPALSIFEFMKWRVFKGALKLDIFTPFDKFIKKYFKDMRLLTLMKFPILFLGAQPKHTPSLYSMMNYSGLKIGTYYPVGGFSKIIEAMKTIALKYGVTIHLNSSVEKIVVEKKRVQAVVVNNEHIACDGVVGAADYAHIDQMLLEKPNYSKQYWSTRTFAPSALIFYLGLNTSIPNLIHHNLFFDNSLDDHATEIYDNKRWPEAPLFYTCCPTKTDNGLAPQGHEILYILMPIAIGLQDNDSQREHYYEVILNRLEEYTQFPIRAHIEYKSSFSVDDFSHRYNAYGGNAYGLANTIRQTAIFKPKMKHASIKNMVYAGQLASPGPGLPPSLISGQIAATLLIKSLK